jgi:hypothetical protein
MFACKESCCLASRNLLPRSVLVKKKVFWAILDDASMIDTDSKVARRLAAQCAKSPATKTSNFTVFRA